MRHLTREVSPAQMGCESRRPLDRRRAHPGPQPTGDRAGLADWPCHRRACAHARRDPARCAGQRDQRPLRPTHADPSGDAEDRRLRRAAAVAAAREGVAVQCFVEALLRARMSERSEVMDLQVLDSGLRTEADLLPLIETVNREEGDEASPSIVDA